MKLPLISVSLFCTLLAFMLIPIDTPSQSGMLKAGVFYNHLAAGKEGSEIVIEGKTTFFDQFEVMAARMEKKPGILSKEFSSDKDELIIVREGQLNISINGQTRLIGPGSVAFIIPGDKVRFEVGGDKAVLYYRLSFKSKLPMDQDRAIKGGGTMVINWNDVVPNETDRGSRRDFFNRPTASCSKYEMHVTTLNEGLSSHQPHTHPEEEIILLLSGNALMYIDGKEYPASPGALVFLPSTIPHALKNAGKGPCQYFAFQWK